MYYCYDIRYVRYVCLYQYVPDLIWKLRTIFTTNEKENFSIGLDETIISIRESFSFHHDEFYRNDLIAIQFQLLVFFHSQ